MLDARTLNNFTGKANHANQQFCVWMYANNEFAKHQEEWNQITLENSLVKGCKYKNFWSVVIPSLQQSWALSLARLFDPAYNSRDKDNNKPRLSLYYILELLNDDTIARSVRVRIEKCKPTIDSIKTWRDNFLAHNDVNFRCTKIEAGVEILFEELDSAISDIKGNKPYLQNCNNINLKYTETLSRCGVEEVFEALVAARKTVQNV